MARRTIQEVEEWRPVVGFEGLYEVSRCGSVRSLDRRVIRGPGSTRWHRGRVLKAKRHQYGYPLFILARDGKDVTRLAHRLVLEAFVGPRPQGMNGCHNDGNAQNNCADNLRWDTQAANIADAIRQGTWSMPPADNRRDEVTGRFVGK